MDRDGREPIDLMDEIERVLGIPTSPINWPIGAGARFQGIFDRETRTLVHFVETDHGARKAESEIIGWDDPKFLATVGEAARAHLSAELELLDVAGNAFDLARFRAGEVTPVFFGSAMNNFGVGPFLDKFIDLAPSPLPRAASGSAVDPAS